MTSGLKNDMRNLANFHQRAWKCQNWDLDGILLSKLENVRASNLQKCYMSWQWRMMKNLKSNWLVISKLTWGIWRILIPTLGDLKHLLFNWLLLPKYIMFELKRSYVWWHWRLMQNLKEIWLVLSKMTWGIWQISKGWNKWIAHLTKLFTHV